ncbi:hypothetical protein IW261DRAFT_1520453 [Armillaria novae-zelandiae]|uniref:F-box domain-containing protein n=1 Tax=Armillaria novae-zelandiae TaxID=153914 RepID=A0AA39NJB3_9AGAR|nr:hypothetical protein IW261DRAFT_1520453 [Armillaria novae-zelandiae]
MYRYSDLPVELIYEILSHLGITSIKSLSLTSSTFHTICFPLLFFSLRLSRRKCTFLSDFRRRAPTPCFSIIRMKGLKKNISTGLLPWCATAHTMKIERGTTSNTLLLPSLTFLKDLKLSSLKFRTVADFYKLLSNLPPTLKKLILHGIIFRNRSYSSYTTVSRGVELEHLETDTSMDLFLLLQDQCPISLKSLRVAGIRQCNPLHLEDLFEITPHLIDLRLFFTLPSQLPDSLPLIRLKSLTVNFEPKLADTVNRLLSTPPDILSTLETLTVTDLLSRPKFRNLKSLILESTALDSWESLETSLLEFRELARTFQRRLEELGTNIDVTGNWS